MPRPPVQIVWFKRDLRVTDRTPWLLSPPEERWARARKLAGPQLELGS
jgi:hypothetical protein